MEIPYKPEYRAAPNIGNTPLPNGVLSKKKKNKKNFEKEIKNVKKSYTAIKTKASAN